ncbi:hypothetical protein QBC38DRAFT_448722 [Podospora fimiseda]|uniref:Conidiation-specific protein n=1 Tax=Podospora fimiseda TaxID=252190 RepID=A0AAN7BGL4_9PEZI|nr:hypothetical protein QBC38DRAFT_448722 [Podospora fimiseda]
MASTLVTALLGAFFLPTALAQSGPSPTLAVKFPNGLNVLDSGTNGGLNAVTSSSYTKTKWAWGTLPKHCYDTASGNGYCNPYDVEVWDIKYSECNVAHTFCRCNNSPLSIDQVAQNFGRVPVGARQWIRYVSSHPAPQCSAWNGGNNMVFLGNCVNRQSVTFHEVAHSLDSWAVGSSGSAYSNTQQWKNIVAMGSCVPDDYSKASWAENWAQVAVMSAYHFNVQSIWNLQVGCMADQQGKSIEQLNNLYRRVAGQTCTRSWQNDPTVCMGPAARDSGNCNGINSLSVQSTVANNSVEGVTIEPAPVLSKEAEAAEKERILHAEEEAGLRKSKRFSA